MILHVVLFAPMDSLSPAQRQQVLDAVTRAATRCPGVRGARLGRRVRHGLPGYEQAMRVDYQYALMLEFDDLQGLQEYLTHPEHAKAGGFFASAAESALAYDYETVSLGEAHTLLDRVRG